MGDNQPNASSANESSSPSSFIFRDRPTSAFHVPHECNLTRLPSSLDENTRAHCEIVYCEKDCAITDERLKKALHEYCSSSTSHDNNNKNHHLRSSSNNCTFLSHEEMDALREEQQALQTTLFDNALATDESGNGKNNMEREKDTIEETAINGLEVPVSNDEGKQAVGIIRAQTERLDTSSSSDIDPSLLTNFSTSLPMIGSATTDETKRGSIRTVKAQLMTAKLRSRLSQKDDGVLGIQCTNPRKVRNSLMMQRLPPENSNYFMYNINQKNSTIITNSIRDSLLEELLIAEEEDSDEEDDQESKFGEEEEETNKMEPMNVQDISYVRKPNLARIVEEYKAMMNHPRYTLKQVVLSRRFHLYAHRFANSQYQRTLVYPTLPQPNELLNCKLAAGDSCPWLVRNNSASDSKKEIITEKKRTRFNGHRFILAADTQFGILMDGFAMDYPNWSQEIDISRKCVAQINSMQGNERPLYVCVCGDLVDTESSFSGAIASWKKVMKGWERNLVFEQQVKDFKRVWSSLDPDIALVCLCGNHDVGNKPTKESIQHWTDSFGDDFLSFWANGTFNICLNNCLFSNPTGAPDLFTMQLQWMEDKLRYARENDATHIFVYGHFPWFLKHEEEADDFLTSYSAAPEGWGPPGSKFADSYFTVPYEQRKIAMELFRKYDVTACFSGHFHQNVVAKTSWGMPMIVTGPLSMNLYSSISNELSNGETNGIGMRIVDVGTKKGEFTHQWTLLNDEEELYHNAIERCVRQSLLDEESKHTLRRSLIGLDKSDTQ